MPKPARADRAMLAEERAGAADLMVRVWDPLVRAFHWLLVLSVATAWFSAHPWATLHYWAGMAAAGLVALRLVWGVVGTPYARFSQFVRAPQTVLGYLKDIATGREARHIGHNPAGGAMVIALILTLIATALSGWLMTTDAFWGVQWMQKLHDLIAHLLLLLVGVHVLGVIVASARHRENLILAMIRGVKRAPEAGDVD